MALRLKRFPLSCAILLTMSVLAAAACTWRTLGAEDPAAASAGGSADNSAGTAGAGAAEAQPTDQATEEERPLFDPLGPNGACYVCHITFLTEHLAKSHARHDIGCVNCHGLSADHANDENVGATKPDITFTRDAIDASCAECHEGHDVPANQVVARFVQRKLPAKSPPVCVDCHGAHKIADAAMLESLVGE